MGELGEECLGLPVAVLVEVDDGLQFYMEALVLLSMSFSQDYSVISCSLANTAATLPSTASKLEKSVISISPTTSFVCSSSTNAQVMYPSLLAITSHPTAYTESALP